MKTFRAMLVRFAGLFRRKRHETDMKAELRAHLDGLTERNLAAGMSPDKARFAALREFGGVEQIKERARDQRALRWVDELMQDIRYAMRQFVRAPGFTAVVVLTLAFGIGATTAIYSVVDAVILRPVPGPHSDRLVRIGERTIIRDKEYLSGVSPPVLEALEMQRDTFADITWSDSAEFERATEDFTTIEFGARVPPNFFTALGARPFLGRGFNPDEAISFETGEPERDTVVVLSYDWWKSQFGADPRVLGTEIEMGGRHFTIVGVMPEYFRYPGYQANYWLPAKPLRPQPRQARLPNTHLVARLQPDVTPQHAQAVLDSIAQRLTREYPAEAFGYGRHWALLRGLRLWLSPLRAEFQDGRAAETLQRTLFGFSAAIAFVLLIVCANIANLALARTERRQHELAVRASLGAGRARLLRQLLTENLLLAGAGGAAGLLVAAWGMHVLGALNTLPRLRPIAIDAPVLMVALAVSLCTGLAFGLAPAWRASRVQLNEALATGSGMTASRRAVGLRGLLIVVQVSTTVVLLAGAGLMIRSVAQALRVNPGFDPANLLTVYLELGGKFRRDPGAEHLSALLASRNALLDDLRSRLAGLPGVQAVGIARENYPTETIALEGATEAIEVLRHYCGSEAGDYFRAARVPLLAGRLFEKRDTGEEAGTAMINETMARLCWPGGNAVGQRFRTVVDGRRKEHVYEVVGIVGDLRPQRFDQIVSPIFYRPFQESGLTGLRPQLVVRTENDPALLVAAIRRELKAASSELMLPEIVAARQVLFDATRAQRTYRNYLLVFAGAGLLLSALGVGGVLAYSVARRTREIGIRIAVGAGRSEVMLLVMGEGGRLILAGIGLGLGGAFGLTRFLQAQLFGVQPMDPAVLSLVVLVLALVGLLACWLPARRAASVDPFVALRAE